MLTGLLDLLDYLIGVGLKKLQAALLVCKLFAACYRTFFAGYRLIIYALGEYVRGLVVFGAAVHIGLL